ncbi:solute carrier family 22 member 3-like [Bradysia coprophila]|uniref:solute carrier family 22 member 3-like n=1 Tax=Bradysia coprophila TaxID=38358 RepID=UPI00187DACE3|nr:solute carrier family 22 member 3-like [Bradysia coprophila]
MVSVYNDLSSVTDKAEAPLKSNDRINGDSERSLTLAEKPSKTDTDFDDLLSYVGDFGTYQVYIFLLMAPFTVFYVFVYFTQIFITLIPNDYWCNVPELRHLEPSDRLRLAVPLIDGQMSKCTMYMVNYTEVLNNNITEADPTWPTQSCKFGYEFDHSEIPYTTIATELGWVCENDYLPTIAQSVFFMGAITGGLLFGWMADHFGRVPALIGTNVIGGIAGIFTAYTNTFWTFALCRYFAGFAFDNCYTIMYILALEYVGSKWRTFVANMCTAIYFAAGALLMPWIALWISNWRTLSIVLSAPLMVAVFTPWIVPESIRWLISQNRMTKAKRIIRHIERVNKRHIDPKVFQNFIESCRRRNETNKNQKYHLLDLFRTPNLRKAILLLIVIYMSVSLIYDGYIRSITSIGLDIFIAFTLASGTEFPASSVITLLLDRLGRRWFLFGTMIACSICSLALSYSIKGNVALSVTLMIAGRFLINIAYNIGQQVATEFLPTVIRAQGVTLVHNLGYVANMLSPLVNYLHVIDPSLPFWVLVVVGVIGGTSILFLPETTGRELPQSLEDGEAFGRNHNFLDNPCTPIPQYDKEITNKNYTSRRFSDYVIVLHSTDIKTELSGKIYGLAASKQKQGQK